MFGPEFARNTVVYVRGDWPQFDGFVDAAAAAWAGAFADYITIVTEDQPGGVLFHFDFNTQGDLWCGAGSYIWRTDNLRHCSGRPGTPEGDLGALLTHELGHMLGFNGLTTTATADCVMHIPAEGFNTSPCRAELELIHFGYEERNTPPTLELSLITGIRPLNSTALNIGDSIQVCPSYYGGGELPPANVAWGTSDSAVTVVDLGQCARIKAMKAGTAAVRATLSNPDGTDSLVVRWPSPGIATMQVTVQPPPVPVLGAYTVVPSPARQYNPFTVTIFGSNFVPGVVELVIADTRCLTSGGSWSTCGYSRPVYGATSTQIVWNSVYSISGTYRFRIRNGPTGQLSSAYGTFVVNPY